MRRKGVASSVYMEEAAHQVMQRSGRIVNVDATIIAEAPKIAPHAHAMKAMISHVLEVHPNRIS
ncbi:MAG: 2-C-methyl-D-erythritol 2,4-cyclodiphosphate synthase, partial [Flavobacteriales bacterium]|nr:2-C-methyl-D-erythritol 2,4-cyclodiphosphate synthase [Flavobacteriales bacterium]